MLTPRQKKENLQPLLRMIAHYIEREGIAPSMRDIAEMAGVKSVSHAFMLVNRMVEFKMISKKSDQARSIKIN